MPPKKSSSGVAPKSRKDSGRKRKADGSFGGKKNPPKSNTKKSSY